MDYCIIDSNTFDFRKIKRVEEPNYKISEEPYNTNDYLKKINYYNIDKFKYYTKDILEFKKIDKDLMYDIEIEIGACNEYANVVNNIYYNNKYLYQLCYVDKDHRYIDKKELNTMGTLLNYENKAICGKVAVFKVEIPIDNDDNILSPIDIKDILFLINSREYHGGVALKENGALEQIYYNNKLDIINLDKYNSINKDHNNCLTDKNYKGYVHDILRFDIIGFVRLTETYEERSLKPNYAMSKIIDKRSEGDCIIIGKNMTNDIYYDIFVEDIANMLRLAGNNKVSEEDVKEERNDKNINIFKTGYRLMYKRLNK